MLNSRGLKTDPCETPKRSFVHKQEAQPESPKISKMEIFTI